MLANHHELGVVDQAENHHKGPQCSIDHLEDILGEVILKEEVGYRDSKAKDGEEDEKNKDNATTLGKVNLGKESKDRDDQHSDGGESTSYHDGLLLVVAGEDTQGDTFKESQNSEEEDVERPPAENLVNRTAD